MPVYVVIEIKIRDREMYEEYIARVPPIVKKYGGRYLARGEEITELSGGWHPERMILIEFPSEGKVQDWVNSPEYLEIAPLRTNATQTRAVIIEGCGEV